MKTKKVANKINSDNIEFSTIHVGRVVKVIKGGRRFRFNVLVVAGNKNGLVGYGTGKGSEVAAAIEKAEKSAKKRMFKIPIIKGTIPHEVKGTYNGSKIMFIPATEGSGIKAGGPARTLCELAGIRNIMSKYFRRNSKHNNLLSALLALKKLRDPISIAKDRGVSLEKVFNG